MLRSTIILMAFLFVAFGCQDRSQPRTPPDNPGGVKVDIQHKDSGPGEVKVKAPDANVDVKRK